MNRETRIKQYLNRHQYDFIDLRTGETNATLMAEDAIYEFEIEDDEADDVFDWAADIAIAHNEAMRKRDDWRK